MRRGNGRDRLIRASVVDEQDFPLTPVRNLVENRGYTFNERGDRILFVLDRRDHEKRRRAARCDAFRDFAPMLVQPSSFCRHTSAITAQGQSNSGSVDASSEPFRPTVTFIAVAARHSRRNKRLLGRGMAYPIDPVEL